METASDRAASLERVQKQLASMPGEVTEEQAKALLEAVRNRREDDNGPPLLQKLYNSLPTFWLLSFAVLGSSMVVAALSNGALGRTPFSLQLFATLILLCILPAAMRLRVAHKLPYAIRIMLAGLWFVLSGAPVIFALLVELFIGHRRPGMQWWQGIWRVYAIVVIWIGLSYYIKHYVKPWWQQTSSRLFNQAASRGTPSVVVQAEKMAMGRREAKLERIKARVAILLRRKKRLDAQIERLSSATEAESGEVGKSEEVDAAKEELEDIEDQLKLAQMEWTEALNMDVHRQFFR